MNRWIHLLFCVGALEWGALAGPEEEFATVVAIVQKGDHLMQQGKDRPAMDEYRKAQEALLKFRQVYPQWDPQVVGFRLRYLGDRLGNWTEPETPKASPSDAELQALQNRIGFLERSGQQYQAQVNQLLQENSRLSARLREALAIRPAAQEPTAIQDTNAKLEHAQKVAMQLEMRVRELEAELAAIPKPEEAKRNAQLLEETRRNLNQTGAETEALRKQLADLRARPEPAEQRTDSNTKATADTLVTNRAVEDELQRLRTENEGLRLQLAALLGRNRAASANPKPADDGSLLAPLEQARLALAEGRLDEAVQLLRAETAVKADRAETWYLLGRAHLERAEFEPAGEALKRARELAPELGAVDLELSRWQVRRPAGDPALARWHYHRALQHGAPRDAALEKEIAWEPLSKAIN